MVVKDTLERVVWVNFDRAKKYDGQLTVKQNDLIEQEEEVVVDFIIYLVSCGPKISMVNFFLIFINRKLIMRKGRWMNHASSSTPGDTVLTHNMTTTSYLCNRSTDLTLLDLGNRCWYSGMNTSYYVNLDNYIHVKGGTKMPVLRRDQRRCLKTANCWYRLPKATMSSKLPIVRKPAILEIA